MSFGKKYGLAAAMEEIENNEQIAQEGFASRVKNIFSRWTTTNKAVLKYLKGIKTFEAVEEKELKDVAWSRVFFDNYDVVTADNIVKIIDTSDKYIKALTMEAAKVRDLYLTIVNNKTLGDSADFIKKFETLEAEVIKKFPIFKIDKTTGDVKTGNDKDIEKVRAAIIKMIESPSDAAFDKMNNEVFEASWDFYHFNENKTTLQSLDNLVIQQGSELMEELEDRITSCIRYRSRIIHGGMMYVKSSLK